MKNNNNETGKWRLFVLALAVGLLLVEIVFALEISNVNAEETAIFKDSVSVLISWETDSAGDSFVKYGEDKENLAVKGDASKVALHKVLLDGLKLDTTYYYIVESEGVVRYDGAGGNLYSFKTSPADTTAPELKVEIPTIIKGNKLALSGKTEENAKVRILIGGAVMGETTAKTVVEVEKEDGKEEGKEDSYEKNFAFENVLLASDQDSLVTIEAEDASGNVAKAEGKVYADNKKPKVTISEMPLAFGVKEAEVKGIVSEECEIEIFNGEDSQYKEKGTTFSYKVKLNEGKNVLKIVVRDLAGWEDAEVREVEADTQAPKVEFSLTGGAEYYEGRAETEVKGKTEAGAKVYLYVFQPQTEEAKLDFNKAIAVAEADEDGNFVFEELEFKSISLMSLKDLHPKEVPAGLEEILLPKLDALGMEQRMSYQVYVIAEDKSGKVGYKQVMVYVNTCFAGDFAFDIYSPEQFPPQPLKLSPSLLDEGREYIQAVYNISYKGGAQSYYNQQSKQEEKGYQIVNVQFKKACTKVQAESDDYSLGCKLLPGNFNAQPIKTDRSIYFLTANLLSSKDFLDVDDDLWLDFQKRMLKMPLKIIVTYKERNADGSWGDVKTQVECRDLGYFVDVPLESSLLVPDSLASASVSVLDGTIDKIETVKPILEQAKFWVGVSCYTSWLTKMGTKTYRTIISFYESMSRKGDASKNEPGCPSVLEQKKLFLDSTIEYWNTVTFNLENVGEGQPSLGEISKIKDIDVNDVKSKSGNYKQVSLDYRCPLTAQAWEAEAKLDLLYKSVCDRYFCRSVPARWTEDRTEMQVDAVELEQKQCAASGTVVQLNPVENCQTLLQQNPANREFLTKIKQDSFTCWRDNVDSRILYYRFTENDPACIASSDCKKEVENLEQKGIWKLKPVNTADSNKPMMLAIAGELNGPVGVAVDKSCESLCRGTVGYTATNKGFKLGNDGKYSSAGGEAGACYKEIKTSTSVRFEGVSKENPLKEGSFAAGYTKDCFVDEKSGERYQCVCESSAVQASKVKGSAREALRKEGDIEERWDYHQAKVFRESGGMSGTYYPEWRYYDGRDFTGAFGQNHITDWIEEDGKEKVTKIDPRTQFWAPWQSLCIPVITDQLTMLEKTLVMLRNCIVQAQNSDKMDAGTCKTLFTNEVCGLAYKLISGLTNDCSPISFGDVAEGGVSGEVEGVGEVFNSLRQGIPEGIKGSVVDLKEDYGAVAEAHFKAGTEGLAQSMCLMAIGYDIPLEFDFLTDAAYSTPMKTDILPTIARRELVSFDPIKGMPTFSYDLGAVIFPGCRIKGYRTTLKCIGPEDLGNPGVDTSCGGAGCDCLNANADPAYSAERSFNVPSGTKMNGLTRLQPHDIPYANPLRITSHYRYDHVKLEVFLDNTQGLTQEAGLCFDKEFVTGQGATFYIPITPIEGQFVVQCSVNPASGKYSCPELSSMFKGGQTYLEYPFMRCYDKKTEEYVDCEQKNLLLLGDDIVIRTYVYSAESASCLKISDSNGRVNLPPVQIPAGVNGAYSVKMQIGKVTSDMFTGGGVGKMTRVAGSSAEGCGGENGQVELLDWPKEGGGESKKMTFSFTRSGENYQLTVPEGVTVVSAEGFGIDTNRHLTFNGKMDLTLEQANKAVFLLGEFRFSKVLGQPLPTSGNCVYQAMPPSSSSVAKVGVGSLNLKAELYELGEGGSCYLASKLVEENPLGKRVHNQVIRVQSAEEEVQVSLGLHDDFMKGNYALVRDKAQAIVSLGKKDINDASALYYWIASLVMGGLEANRLSAVSLLREFFERGYSAELEGTTEFKKIKTYLCLVDDNTGKEFAEKCKGIDRGTTVLKCFDHNILVKKDGQENFRYKCLDDGKISKCNVKNGNIVSYDTLPADLKGTDAETLCKG
jgi:hypothetical protein